DGAFDLVVLARDGALARLSRRASGWDTGAIVRSSPPGSASGARLILADLDNNGALDLIVSGSSGTRVLLAQPKQEYAPLASVIPMAAYAAADLDGDGRLELIGIESGGRAVRVVSRGTRSYRWQVF